MALPLKPVKCPPKNKTPGLVRFSGITHILSIMQHEENKSSASDAALLRRFARQGRQAAFSELVSRYSGLVYSTCLRDIRNAAVAEDAAQAVFLLLARKAPTFGAGTSLAGWLYRTARLVSRNAVQQETRTRLREQRLGQHMVVEGINGGAENELWDQLEPVLHNALDALGRQDREAILLRFFDDRSLKEIGAALGLSEDAARMRVSLSGKAAAAPRPSRSRPAGGGTRGPAGGEGRSCRACVTPTTGPSGRLRDGRARRLGGRAPRLPTRTRSEENDVDHKSDHHGSSRNQCHGRLHWHPARPAPASPDSEAEYVYSAAVSSLAQRDGRACHDTPAKESAEAI